jgi:hypothetical protein
MSKVSFAGAAPSRLASAMNAWLVWQKKHGNTSPIVIRTFKRGAVSLVVHEYLGGVCGVLELTPRVQKFRPWNQRLALVTEKLKSRGWEVVAEVNNHVRH